MTPWLWRQRFAIRASTLILLYLVFLFTVGWIDLHVLKMPELVERFLGASGWSIWALLLIAAVFALAFFAASLAKRRPQFQFLAEFVVASGAFALLPVY